MIEISELPDWYQPLAKAARDVDANVLSRFVPPEGGDGRESAVLILLGEGPLGPDVLITQRPAALRSHPGQPSFPGGSSDPGDADAIETALREAEEEVGLDRSGVEIVALLPKLWLPPSNFYVTPVLAWWRDPNEVHAVSPDEVEWVARVPISDLVDPANRWRLRHPSGIQGPAFDAEGMLIWGFTGGLLDKLMMLAGWEQPWDTERYVEIPPPYGEGRPLSQRRGA